MEINVHDTVKDKEGNRYYVLEMSDRLQAAKLAKLKGEGKKAPGAPRTVSYEALMANYKRIAIAPVTSYQIEPKVSDKPVDAKEKTSVKLANYGTKKDGWTEESKVAYIKGINEKLSEEIRDLNNTIEMTNDQLRVRDAEFVASQKEVENLRKTISKMRQSHEAEVQDLKDQIGELEAHVKVGNRRQEALDNDADSFQKIFALAKSIEGMADSMRSLAVMIRDETEGRI